MSKILRPIIFIVLLAFAGCTVGPEYSLPEAATPANFSELTRGFSEPAEHWVKIYNDTELEKLVKKAREHNHDLAALYQRTLQSRAIIRSESAQRRPQLNSGASYERFERTESRRQLIVGENGDGTLNSVRLEESTGKVKSDNYNARLDLGWEIDLFGRVSRLVEAAQLDSDAAEAAYQDLLLITETDVAVAYFRIRSLDRELLAVARSVETRRKSLDIVKKRFNSGAISDLDVAQAETVLAESEAELSFLKRERDILEHALAVLTGQPAPDFSIVSKTLEGTPVAPPLALPSELLQRRPDIRQSELELQTANARIGVATANFYPRISLNANAGYAAMEADKWFSNSAEFFGFGPQVSLPIFQGGRLRAELSRTEAAYAERLELYRQTILEAFAEVENAISGWQHLSAQRAARERAASSAARAQSLSERQYKNGLIDFITALDSERVALDSERRLAQVIGEEYVNSVRLIRAIGGTWE